MRFRLINGMITSAFIFYILFFWYFQCARTDYYKGLSEKNRIRLVPLPAPRGNIYDRNGGLCVGSRLAFDCAAVPQEFKDDGANLRKAGALVGLSPIAVKAAVQNGYTVPFASVPLKKDIGKDEAISISERLSDVAGLTIETRPVRDYVLGSAGSHVFGYLGFITEGEYAGLRDFGYTIRDRVGRTGLEKQYNEYLKGRDGGMQIEVDSRGRQIRIIGIMEPVKGIDLYTTIDAGLEVFVDKVMEEKKGVVIVMDSRNGEILAFVSKPGFDPNVFVTSGYGETVRRILARGDYPLINRGINGVYPPGSVFKVVTSSAALDTGRISEQSSFTCGGSYSLGRREFKCWKKEGHGVQDVRNGLKNSCNVFFYNVGRKAGVDLLSDYACRFGFGSATGIDLPREAAGIVPDAEWKRAHMGSAWFEGETLNYSIGQGYLLVTPLQVLRMVNVAASDGMLVKPYIGRRIGSIDLGVGQGVRAVHVSERTLAIVRDGLAKAVNDPDGTARHARADGLSVAGKTGTAQTPAGKTHAWFCGYSPADGARVTLVVFLEHGGSGGGEAGPIASKVFTELRGLGYL